MQGVPDEEGRMPAQVQQHRAHLGKETRRE